jgi:hypothetical protein
MIKLSCPYALMALLLFAAQAPPTSGPSDLQYPWFRRRLPLPPRYRRSTPN